MGGVPEILIAVIPIYLLMVVGGVLRRADVLGSQMDTGLTNLVIHVLYPALILDKVLRAELLRDPGIVFSAIGVGFSIISDAIEQPPPDNGQFILNRAGPLCIDTCGEYAYEHECCSGFQIGDHIHFYHFD